jgi:hypothetical protein
MKTFGTTLFILCLSILTAAQNPLVGTWELASVKSIKMDSAQANDDPSALRITMLITPTHYMFISHHLIADSLVFDKAIAGTIKVTGNKFVETPIYVSDKADAKAKTDFTWKMQGDKLVQSGTIMLADGKKITVTELAYNRVKLPTAYTKNPSLGTWQQLSSGFTFENGLKDYHTHPAVVRFRIVNPTHFMQINIRNGEFEGAAGGPYTIEGGAMVPTFNTASFKLNPADNTKNYIDQSVEGDIWFVKGSTISGEGKETFKWEDIFRRVGK